MLVPGRARGGKPAPPPRVTGAPPTCPPSTGARSFGIDVSLRRLRPSELDDLEAEWRALESAASPSFFTSWTWIGCARRQRFVSPVLLQARVDGRLAALALFNQSGSWPSQKTLWLGESGSSVLDAVYIEHNGILVAADARPELRAACLDACFRAPLEGEGKPRDRRLILSGVPARMTADIAAAGGAVRVRKMSIAPRIEFAALAGSHLDSLTGNARYQIRRSDRQYQKRGPLRLERANDPATAHAYLDALAVLHERYWISRGRPGAFASPAFASFHHELIERGMPRDEIDLLRIAAGDHVVGYLYNFRHQGRVYAYQSGFDYQDAHPHEKPGLVCHRLAIERAREQGCVIYDFLAGDDRYKTSLANSDCILAWLDVYPAGSLRFRALALRDRAKGAARSLLAGGARKIGKTDAVRISSAEPPAV